MKRTIAILVFAAVCFSLAAFSFSMGPEAGFFGSLKSDVFSPKTRLGVIDALSTDPEGELIRFDKKDGVPGEYYSQFKTFNKDKDNYFLLMQAGGGASTLRFSWDGFEVGARIEAYIRGVFFLLNGNDVLGFDGSYFLGCEARILDSIIFRFGARHYSGHVGDETFASLVREDPSMVNADLSEYVRDDFEIALGYSSEAFPYIKGAVSVIIPQKYSYMMPFVHRPDYIISGGKTNQERDPESYAIRGDYGPAYKALILTGELTFSYRFGRNDVFLSLQGRLHQDGMTSHTLTRDDDTSQWEAEFDAAIGIERTIENRHISLEVIWHNGRFPLLNYYWKRMNSISIVFSVS